jgi:hypothetical protein
VDIRRRQRVSLAAGAVGLGTVEARISRLEHARGPELTGLLANLTLPETLAVLTDSQRLDVVKASATGCLDGSASGSSGCFAA